MPTRRLYADLIRACLVSCVLTSTVVVAGTNTWTSMGLQGGAVFDLAIHPTTPSTMYATTLSGMYRTTDAGTMWQRVSAPPLSYFQASTVAIEPQSPDNVYIGGLDGYAWRSTDRGASVSITQTTAFVADGGGSYSLAVARDGSAIYYPVGAKVYRSTDHGASRELRGTVPTGLLIGQLRVDDNDPQVLYAAAYDGVYRSDDGGASWQAFFLPANASSDGVYGFALDPSSSDRMWLATSASLRVSVNRGVTWSVVLPDTVSDIDFDPAVPDVAYASLYDNRVLKTINGGASWSPLPVPQRAAGAGRPRLATVPGQSNKLYLFGNGALFGSDDSGATWQRADGGLDATSPWGFSASGGTGQTVYFPIAEYGIGYIGSDRSRASVLSSPSLSVAAGGYPPSVSSVTAGGDQSRELVAVIASRSIVYSLDHGSNWSVATEPPPGGLQLFGVSRVRSARTVFLTTSNGLYRSEDGGDRWVSSSDGLPANTAVTGVTATVDPMVLFATVNDMPNAVDTVYKSTDGGYNWSRTSGELHTRLVSALTPHPTDALVMYVGSNQDVFRTTDGGATWRSILSTPAPASVIAIDPTDPRIIYWGDAGPIGRVRRSVDGGATYQSLMPEYYTDGGPASLLIDAAQPDRIIAAIPGGGVREFSIATDMQLTLTPATGTVATGQQAAVTMTINNRGPFDATAIRLEAQLPDPATGISATSSNGSCSVAAQLLTCVTDALHNGASVTISMLATPTTGAFRVNADVSARQADVASGNNVASSNLTVTAVSPSRPAGGGGGGGGGAMFFGWQSLWLLALVRMRCARLSRPA